MLALITEAVPPVVTRVLFSEADLRGRALFVKKLCREAELGFARGCRWKYFRALGRFAKKSSGVATGSHIDAIPNAGKYDGVVGVLGAIEAIRALEKIRLSTEAFHRTDYFHRRRADAFWHRLSRQPFARRSFAAGKSGGLRDRDGKNLEFWRKRGGCKGKLDSVKLSKNFYSAFVELHIEQGPILEKEKISIGIVEKIAAPSSLRLQLTGVGGHAGATLMPERRDAGLAGAEISLAVEHAAKHSGSADTVGTTGIFASNPARSTAFPAARIWKLICATRK
jgi:ureidoglycolate amidohydrolase